MKEGTNMEGKFTSWQRIVLIITFLVIVISGAIRLLNHAVDPGAVIVLLFVAMLLYVILCVAALFPATWRMTDKEKKKILYKDRYQKKYAGVCVVANALLSSIMIFLIWIV